MMETINDIIYELNGNAKTKALAKRIELAKINDEQRWRKDIADTRRLTAERALENIELYEKARCQNCIVRRNLKTIQDLCQEIGVKYNPSQKKYHTPEIQTINKCFRLACEALRKENGDGND
jgi:hypothetical protein